MQHSSLRLATLLLAGLGVGCPGPHAVQAQTPVRVPYRLAEQPSAPAGGPARPAAQPGMGPAAGQPPRTAGDDNQKWREGTPPVAIAAKAPFKLTPEQEKQTDDALKTWEQKSEKIHTFKCQFLRWDYDLTFGDPAQKYLKAQGSGEIKYKAPDHGKYYMNSMSDVVVKVAGAPGELVKREDADLERWVCDGDSIYEYKPKETKLVQHKLPKELRGKSISDGPLPFIFGAKADQIKRRYFVRLITPAELEKDEVWVEAWPRFQVDAANFQRVWIILKLPEYEPAAMQIFLPGEVKLPLQSSRTAYGFKQTIINDPLSILKGDFLPPITPPFWKKVVEDPSAEPPPSASPPPAATAPAEQPNQARRAATPIRR